MGGRIVANSLVGTYVTLREVSYDDIDFILSLRCDEKKAKYLHKTEYNPEAQKDYLKAYFEKKDEWYFISLNKEGEKIGTYRIYDIKGDSFCFGSWLMIDGVSPVESFETDFLVRMYGFNDLGFNKIHFDVRKDNKKVWRYHMSLGAVLVGETDIDYLFELTKEDYLKKATKFMKALDI